MGWDNFPQSYDVAGRDRHCSFSMNPQQAVIRYYENITATYRKYWYGKSTSYGFHCGFWERNTKTLDQALKNADRFLATCADIGPGDRVLDAGCGVGGSVLWLALAIAASPTGVSISPTQIEEAKRLAEHHHLGDRVQFLCTDYCQTPFADESFDVVWALESMCHAPSKAAFVEEAYRLLAPGGRLVVNDVFLSRTTRSKREWRQVHDFETGMAVPDVLELNSFHDLLTGAGFEQVRVWDKSKSVLPSLRRMYWVSHVLYPLLRYPVRWWKDWRSGKPSDAERLAVHDEHIQAGRVLYPLISSGLGRHVVFCALKPRSPQTPIPSS